MSIRPLTQPPSLSTVGLKVGGADLVCENEGGPLQLLKTRNDGMHRQNKSNSLLRDTKVHRICNSTSLNTNILVRFLLAESILKHSSSGRM